MLGDLTATHPARTLLPVSFALSFLSLSLTPSFIPLVLLLTSLLLFTRQESLKSYPFVKVISLWVTLTLSISISHLQPSIHALSTPSTSIASLFLLSGLSSSVALATIISRHYVKRAGRHTQFLVFPTLWTVVWLGVSWISPLGRLVTWTPLTGIESYRWIRPFLGFSGIDWIAAAWASIAGEVLASTIYRHEQEENLLIEVEHESRRSNPTRESPKHLAPWTGLLLVLTLPSFFVNTLPLPPMSSRTTPLGVACILPETSEQSQLERYMKETLPYANAAKILLWPEGAVTFETETDKKQAFEIVQEKITEQYGTWVGVSFVERVSGTGSTRDGLYRNGMALVGPEGLEMTYYKRRLVPIAESFSQIGSSEAPPIHTIDLHKPPKHVPKDEWNCFGPRTITLSTSICLDFSAPLTSLSSHPALVLAPAKTWHTGVGRAMYELARARGEEIGAEVLWCDGGAGGLSGVAENVQVGSGTWIKIIGVSYPDDQRRTLYGICGDWLALAVLIVVPGLTLASQRYRGRIGQTSSSAITWTRQRSLDLYNRIRGRSHGDQNANTAALQSQSLIDDT